MSDAKNLTILCVDDDPVGLQTQALVLKHEGYKVLTANSGQAALALFKSSHVDLVISDHLLPDHTGADLAAQLKQLRPSVPIIIVSGLPDQPEETEHLDAYLVKGPGPGPLLSKITELLTRR